MKRMILFLSAALFSLGIFAKQTQTSIVASAKQAPTTAVASAKQAPTTILVMDSANALLQDVRITAKGYEPFNTSFDGRYVMGLPLQNDLQLTHARADGDHPNGRASLSRNRSLRRRRG
mgnify:CR=1 FL=1